MNFLSTSFLVLSLLFSYQTIAAEVSFTIDDPGVQATEKMSHKQVAQKILKHLKLHNLKTTLFVCGQRIDNSEGREILALWDQSNHSIGNHTYSHKNYNLQNIDFPFFSSDIMKNEELIKGFRNFKKIFRYPMLKEGDSTVKRDQLRSYLTEKGYSIGHVTIDASDWFISARLLEKLKKEKKLDLTAYKKYYLDHIWQRAQYYNELSKKVLNREVKHNVLLHHNPLNAYFLGDLIQMFKERGWKVIDSDEAFKDPVYKRSPQITPAGESLIWALAKESGKFDSLLRYPGEDGEYQREEMDKLGL